MQFQKDTLDHPLFIKSFDQQEPRIEIIQTNNASNNKNNNSTTFKTSHNIVIVKHSVLLTFDNIIDTWQPVDHNELKSEDITVILDYKPEIILIGTGKSLEQLDYAVLEPLFKSKTAFEVMSTDNACRTYNILASEHRKVAAGLIL